MGRGDHADPTDAADARAIPAGMVCRPAALAEIVPLRHAVLRAGLPPEAAVFEGDDHPATRHFAAVSPAGTVVGCVTLMPQPLDGAPAWQLRGMATRPDVARRGIGSVLLAAALRSLASEVGPDAVVWCNARVPAVGFYRRHGWTVVSEPFDIPTAGPHVRMRRAPA